uniref:Small ribosomal subunit protein uS10 domain-containing protein n=1 Tax=Glossina pallidipes TaxID=7398 RepID=A0A1A9ZIU1_GLOPL
MLRKFTPLLQRKAKQLPITYLCNTTRNISDSKAFFVKDLYEPDYLESLKPKFPQFENLNVQLKGYDYPILESYQRYLHKVAEYLDIDVADCYALPPQHMTVQRLRPNSTAVDAEYRLTVYERNLHLEDVSAPIYPLFLRIAQAALPEGVELSIQEHTEECEERRYVPDRDLLDLKAELERIQSGTAKKK